jgi:transcriptional regulator with XRE-family HTH domain
MNTYKRDSLLDLLDPDTIKALKNIYGLSLKHLAARLNMTPQAVFYLLKNDRLKEYQKEIILSLFQDHGLESAELIVLHTMIQKRVKK